MSETVITIDQLCKSYWIKHQLQDGRRMGQQGERFSEVLSRVLSAPFRRRSAEAVAASREEFWALKDVSFEVKRGEVLGIIGRNGAGKSTLLKILSRITEPTSGRVEIDGRVASLLEVGTGFHPELTGRENIFLNGAILGMSRVEIKRKFDEIVAFAEVEKFLDTPVKRYSSGMYVRLAFAVAAHLDPEILIVDEVLAVGDVQFQKKCLGKMRSISRQEGRTILFVSHNMQAVATLSNRVIFLEQGRVSATGAPGDMVDQYLQAPENSGTQTVWQGDVGDESLRLQRVRVVECASGILTTDKELRLRIVAEILQPIYGLVFAVEVHSSKQQLLAYSAHDDADEPPPVTIPPGPYAWEVTIPGDTFASGVYELRVDIGIHNVKKIVQETLSFNISFENTKGIGRRFQSHFINCFRPNWPWRRLTSQEIAAEMKSPLHG